jgi:hypothetical protein
VAVIACIAINSDVAARLVFQCCHDVQTSMVGLGDLSILLRTPARDSAGHCSPGYGPQGSSWNLVLHHDTATVDFLSVLSSRVALV